MQRAAVRVVASLAAAAAIAALVYAALPSGLDVRTDIVGYPTFADFDIDRYLQVYALAVVVFPVAAIALYVLLTRLVVGPTGPWRPLPGPLAAVEEVPPLVGSRTWAVAAGRALVVGLAGGLELAIVLDGGCAVMLATAVLYAGVVLAAGRLVELAGRGDRFATAAVLNALTTPLLVAGLWAVSRSTEIEVTSTGEVHGYTWLPGWLALGAAAVLLGLLAVARRRRAGLRRVERLAVGLVAAPVVIFLVLAELPGELGTFDSYEEGQALAGAELVRDGAFPWRDLMLTHGLLSDVVRGLIGFAAFDESRWGLVAADQVLLLPLAWVALYYLCAYLFWTNWMFLLGTQLLVVTGVVTEIETRFLLVPFVLLLLAALLARPTVPRAVAFTFLLFVQVLVTPEALVVAAASLATLAAFELAYRRRGQPLAVRYRRLGLCLAAALGLTVVWALFLAAFGALDDWGFALASVLPGHRLTGGIELLVGKTEFDVVAPVAAVLATYAFLAARVLARRPLARQDWLLAALGLLTLIYYTKFLSRADRFHLVQSFSVAVPLLFYLGFRALTFGEALLVQLARRRRLGWFPRRHTLTIPLLAVLLLAAAPEPLSDVVESAPRGFEATVGREPELPRIGYARPGENDVAALEALDAALGELLEPGDTVFDFSNAPGVLHYLLDLPPSTRYYHVSFAIRERSQSDLLRELESRPAGVVVLPVERVFNNLPAWDGISNQVRHYDVSERLLDDYVPVQEVSGFVLLAPRGRGLAADPDLYFAADACDWGYAPNFLTKTPSSAAPARRLRVQRSPDGTRIVVILPPGAAGYRWLELGSGAPLARGRFELTDQPGGDSRRTMAFSARGHGERILRVNVGACSQWRGYRPGQLVVTSDVPQDVDRVRLLR